VGRTARADATGVALTLVNEDDMAKFHQIEQLIEREVFKIPIPEHLGKGPEWKTPALRNRKKFIYRKNKGNKYLKRKKKH
jgi:superfamily II DNA/RNA helicase